MTNISKVEEHSTRVLKELPEQFKNKPNLEKFLKVFTEEMDEIEGMFYDLLFERGLSNAVGKQLDVIGEIVKEPRQGRDDTTYKAAILLRIGFNTANSTEDSVIGLLSSLFQTDNLFIQEDFPANLIINGVCHRGYSRDEIADFHKVVAAGVGVIRANLTTENLPFFNFAEDAYGEGFSDSPDDNDQKFQEGGAFEESFLIGDDDTDAQVASLLLVDFSGSLSVIQGYFEDEGLDLLQIGSGDGSMEWQGNSGTSGIPSVRIINGSSGSQQVSFKETVTLDNGTTYNVKAEIVASHGSHISKLKIGSSPGANDYAEVSKTGSGTLSGSFVAGSGINYITMSNGANVSAANDTVDWFQVSIIPNGAPVGAADIDTQRKAFGDLQYKNSKMYYFTSGNDKGNLATAITVEDNFTIEFNLHTKSDVTTRQSIFTDTNTVPVDGIFLYNSGIGVRINSVDYNLDAELEANSEYKIQVRRKKDQLYLTVDDTLVDTVAGSTEALTLKFFANALSGTYPQFALRNFSVATEDETHFWRFVSGTNTVPDEDIEDPITLTIDNHVQSAWVIEQKRNDSFFLQEWMAFLNFANLLLFYKDFETTADAAVTAYEGTPNNLTYQVHAQVLTDAILDRTVRQSLQNRIDAV